MRDGFFKLVYYGKAGQFRQKFIKFSVQTLFNERCWESFHCWIVLPYARTPATIASAKRLVLAVQRAIIYNTHNNTDGAIPTIYVTYFRQAQTTNYYAVIFKWKNGRMEE